MSGETARFRPTRVVVDLGAIRHNVSVLKPDGAELMAVVKANAYGHGAVPVARAAIEAGATWAGVALVEEGLELRLAGIEAPILVLSEFPAGSEAVALAHRLTPTVYTDAGLARLVAAARGTGRGPREDRHRHAPRGGLAARGCAAVPRLGRRGRLRGRGSVDASGDERGR